MFTKQHYRAIAKGLAKIKPDQLTAAQRQGFNKALIALCRVFADDNRHFSSTVFVEACGRDANVAKIIRGET